MGAACGSTPSLPAPCLPPPPASPLSWALAATAARRAGTNSTWYSCPSGRSAATAAVPWRAPSGQGSLVALAGVLVGGCCGGGGVTTGDTSPRVALLPCGSHRAAEGATSPARPCAQPPPFPNMAEGATSPARPRALPPPVLPTRRGSPPPLPRRLPPPRPPPPRSLLPAPAPRSSNLMPPCA